jgi:hypothetical protein
MEEMELNPRLLDDIVRRARDLTYDMFSRLKRLPDYADFRAAFEAEIFKGHNWLDTTEAAGPANNAQRTSPYHPTKL